VCKDLTLCNGRADGTVSLAHENLRELGRGAGSGKEPDIIPTLFENRTMMGPGKLDLYAGKVLTLYNDWATGQFIFAKKRPTDTFWALPLNRTTWQKTSGDKH